MKHRFRNACWQSTLLGFVIVLVLAACSSVNDQPKLTEELSPQAFPVGASLRTNRYSDAFGWNTQPFYYETIRFPDLNGDGKADVCGRNWFGLECSFGNGTAFGFGQAFYPNHFSNAQNWHTHPSYWQTIQYPDVNADGRSDVCSRGGAGIYCAITNAAGQFGSPTLWTTFFRDIQLPISWKADPSYWSTIQFADVNGDRRDDVCGRYVDGIYCALSTGFGFAVPRLWTTSFSDASGFKAADYYYGTIRFADLNGDRRADVCGRGIAGVSCAISTGFSFGVLSLWTTQYSDTFNWHTTPAYWSTLQFADINNDGKADICGRGTAGMYCGRSTGFNFADSSILHVPQFSDVNSWNLPQHYSTIRVVDVNGDGKADICGRGWAGIYCAHSSSTLNTISFDPLYLRVDNFRDSDGWNGSPAYWKTIRPANLDALAGYEFCGRGNQGIICSND